MRLTLMIKVRIDDSTHAGAGRISWDYDTVEPGHALKCGHVGKFLECCACGGIQARVASAMKDQLPAAVTDLIQGPAWRGGQLIRLKSELGRPSVQEVSLHYHFVKPWAREIPNKVPSAFMITDGLLLLNNLLDEKLFPRVKPEDSVQQKAAEEAVKLKKLIQSLRYLYRSSGSFALWFMRFMHTLRLDGLGVACFSCWLKAHPRDFSGSTT